MPFHSHEHSGNATFPATAMTRRDPRATVQDGNRVLCRGEDAVFLLHHATGLGMGSVRKSDKSGTLRSGKGGRRETDVCSGNSVCFVRHFFYGYECVCFMDTSCMCVFFLFLFMYASHLHGTSQSTRSDTKAVKQKLILKDSNLNHLI